MKWTDTNPHGNSGSLRQDAMFDMYKWARQNFASAFARGGTFAATAFAPTTWDAFKTPFRKTLKYGSDKHIENLKRIQAAFPEDQNIANTIKKARQGGSQKIGMLKRAGAFGMGVGFVALPMFTTPGSLQEKARATAGGLVGWVGWNVGSQVGMGTGAAIGSIIPGLGTAIGAAVGYIAGGLAGSIGFDEGFRALSRIPDRMVERERAKRQLNWVGDKTAFMTQSAHTMRQQSLQAMNRGTMTSRSMLGREGVMMHQ